MKLPKIDLSKFNDISKKLTTPTAFSAYATIGVLATTVLAIAITRKDCQNKFEKNSQQDISEKEFTREEVVGEVKETVKTYAPVLLSAAFTIFCIRKSNQKWIAYNSLINTNYLAARDKMARYRALAAPAVGAEIVQGLHGMRSDEGVQWFCIESPEWGPAILDADEINNILNTPHVEPKMIYFQSTSHDVLQAMYDLNRNFAIRGSASAKELFTFLGIQDKFPEEYEDRLGWDAHIMMGDWGIQPWIDFEILNTKDRETDEDITAIYYSWEPGYTPDYSQLAWGYDYTGSFYESNMGGPPYKLSPKE